MADTQPTDIEKKYCPSCYQKFEGNIDACPSDGSTLIDPKNCPLIGTTFAERYTIQSVLGMGGMSIVYKAQHRLMNRIVAIKMLHNKLKEDITSLERFKLEAQAASSLSHQNIITVYDFGVTPDGDPFFVMDCLEGESLEELIERKGRVSYERALPIFKQVCAGLDAAHKKGIIHRDLKPANIILVKHDDGTELVKIVDFGIAKMISGKAQQHLTQTGEVFGSPIYMSPEQCLGKELNTQSDLYALGCLMYDTLAGSPPFEGDNFLTTMNMHVSGDPKPIKEVAPDANIPSELEPIILKCLAKNPADRFKTAGDVQDALSAVSASLLVGTGRYAKPSGATVTVKSPRSKPPISTILLGLATALLLGAVGFVVLFPGPLDDRGSPFNKMRWQISLSHGEDALKSRDFATAEGALSSAESVARTFGDGKSRLEATLKIKAELYDKWEGHAEELEKVNTEIARIEADRLKKEFANRIILITSLDQSGGTPVQQSTAKLRAEAQTPSIMTTALKLHGAKLFEEEEQMLEKATAVETKLLGGDSIVVAQLETQLADCLIVRRKYPQVRSLLAHICQVQKKTNNESSSQYIRALARLGQFDLDQNDFKSAEPELTKADQLSKDLKTDNTTVLLCMRSYADLLRQTNREAAAKKLQQEADALEQKTADTSN